MQGTWKENINGYSKDIKRKKHSRKHTLKDKAKWHIKHTDGYSNYQVSNKTVISGDINYIIPTKPPEKQWVAEIWSIDIDNYSYSYKDKPEWETEYYGFFQGNTRLAYEYHNNWYDIYDGELIEGVIKKLNKIDEEFIDWDKDLPDVKDWGRKPDTKITIYLYGKPLPVNYWKQFGFYSSKGRVHTQKLVNKRDRQRVKTYISNEDWDANIRTHSLSKSIDWEIW